MLETGAPETIRGADSSSIAITRTGREIFVQYRAPGGFAGSQNIFAAFRSGRQTGAAVLPFAAGAEGSTVFLPFKGDLLLSIELRDDVIRCYIRRWERWGWSEREQTNSSEAKLEDGQLRFQIPRALFGGASSIDFVIYAKDPTANHGWGWFWGCSDNTVEGGIGDKAIPHYHELRLDDDGPLLTFQSRYGSADSRTRIYQLFVRLFGNTNETRKQNGTLADNGVGKFADINDAALSAIPGMGFTHTWLTGVLQP